MRNILTMTGLFLAISAAAFAEQQCAQPNASANAGGTLVVTQQSPRSVYRERTIVREKPVDSLTTMQSVAVGEDGQQVTSRTWQRTGRAKPVRYALWRVFR